MWAMPIRAINIQDCLKNLFPSHNFFLLWV